MPNIVSKFDPKQLARLVPALKIALPVDEHGNVVITDISDPKVASADAVICASDDCTHGTTRTIEKVMTDIGIPVQDIRRLWKPFEVNRLVVFGGEPVSIKKLCLPTHHHLLIDSTVTDLNGELHPFVRINGAADPNLYGDFLKLVKMANTHSEVEAVWPSGRQHFMTFHLPNTFEQWLSLQQA